MKYDPIVYRRASAGLAVKSTFLGALNSRGVRRDFLERKIFPTLLILLDVFAAVGYLYTDWRCVVYWLAAAILTFIVTW